MPANAIEAENCKAGNPSSEWDIIGAGDQSIQGFATDISVNKGETVHFKVDTKASGYRVDIYRIGYYGGLGARKMATVNPSVSLPQTQPACISDSATKLTDCGNWSESASWVVPANAVSGVYIARLVRTDTGGASHIIFIVRDDTGNSDILFKTSDTTWQAYNTYGLGYIEYPDYGWPNQKAKKSSYNRPFLTRDVNSGMGAYNWFFQAEYPMVRWLEANGYNVSYFTSVDTDRRGAEILEHKAFLSVGHDEYWSGQERANVEAARSAGVNLAFFSGNEIYRKVRWENSIDGSGTPYRTLVCYNESNAPSPVDPLDPAIWTGTWRNPTFSPPADGGRPENALSGTLFTVSDGPNDLGISLEVPQANGRMRFWRNTAAASLAAGQKAVLGDRVVGYEFDEDIDNGFRPAGLVQLSSTTTPTIAMLLGDNINIAADIYLPGTATHVMTLYRAPSKALVFSAGTVHWSWGLDAAHDNGPSVTDTSLKQATVNILADMGVQPGSLQTGLVAATPSNDLTAPVSTITSPPPGFSLPAGSTITITGTASDSGGGVVGAVEVSTDNGSSWHPASGRESWSYTWTPAISGQITIRSRSVDDSGNIETPSAGMTVTVTPQQTNFTIWPGTTVPGLVDGGPDGSVELGVKFRSDSSGYVTGIRF
ncbi:MAG: Ig-like domain-containing protein, partial [Desulfobacteraceae bacterium]|nr:Ig-like domain-containing protein [Desulfobacteraceae bacterium]